MEKRIDEFNGVNVDEEQYARFGPALETMRELLRQARLDAGDRAGRLESNFADAILDIGKLGFPAATDMRSGKPKFSIDQINRSFNALLVQVGSKCHHGRPASPIEHHIGPFISYYQCGHGDPPHYWDEDGVKLSGRP